MAAPKSLGEIGLQTVGEAIAFAAGFAAGRALEPVGVALAQNAWEVAPIRAVDPVTAAQVVAEDVEQAPWGEAEAKAHGIDAARFEAIVGEVLNAPGFGELLTMLRRGDITAADFEHGLRKAKLETRWDTAVAELEHERLDPAVIALAIVRGLIEDPGILPVAPPAGAGKVPRFPTFNVDAVAEAKAAGIDLERLSVMVGTAGRPMGPEAAAQALFRGILEQADYERAISEGDVRNEWRDPILEHAREIPSATDFVAARLRAWIDDSGLHAGAARHGMAAADADLLLKIHGRPLSWHQVFIGLRRGGTYDGPHDEIDQAFLKALEESDVRPEWYSLAWAQRYTYPAPFVLRALTTSGELSAAETEQILLFEGWEPELAHKVATRWAGTSAAGAKAETKTELEAEYAGGYITETEFREALTGLGYTGHVQDLLVALNDARRVAAWREKAVTAIGKKHIGAGFDAAKATADLAQVEVIGHAAELLVDLWGRESVALTD